MPRPLRSRAFSESHISLEPQNTQAWGKLSVLREAQRGLLDDINANAALGEEVEANLKAVCKSNEFEKYHLFIGDLDKVVNLLLSLSGRLARVENALNSIDSESNQEKLVLIEKKQQLTNQLADAKELKEHVDGREKLVFGMVSRYLPQDQLQDYQQIFIYITFARLNHS